MENFKQLEDKPSQRPDLSPPSVAPTSLPQSAPTQDHHSLIAVIAQLTDSIKLLTLSNLCSSEEDREQIRKQVMMTS